jgi:hypothetical protein
MTMQRWIAIAVLTLLAGCQVTPPAPPPAQAPTLQLIDSQPLVLAPGCEATGSVFVQFVVRADGRTDALQMPPTTPCLRDALTDWVSSFRYAPIPAATPAGLEWMLVSAQRGS